MNNDFHKRNYHPIIILLYVSGMLDIQQLGQLPKTTKHNWNKFKHENYFGVKWAENYIYQFDNIKDVFASAFLYKTIRFMVKSHRGYHKMLQELIHNKNLLKLHAHNIVESIEQMSAFAKIKITTACKYYGISKDWYYLQKRKVICKISPLKSCYRQHPNQLTQHEVTMIEKTIFDANNFGKSKTTLYYTAMDNGDVFCGKSTFSNYATALGYKKPKRFKKIKKHGFRAIRVFEWLHVDITYVQTLDDGLQALAFVKDNFSKSILHYASTTGKSGSEFIKNLFQETFDRHNLFDYKDPINILSDGGSENKGKFISWVNGIIAPPIVSKITAQTVEFPYSNSMSESTHSIYKTEFMNGKISKNTKTHLESLKRFFIYYNQERYFTEHTGLRPIDILNGKMPDKFLFKEQIEQARKNRIQTNRQFNACVSKISRCGMSNS